MRLAVERQCAVDVTTLQAFGQERLTAALRESQLLAGFCYTQLTDTYQEANGLLYADRSPKFPIEQIRKATVG